MHGFVYVERNHSGVYDPDPVQIQAVRDSIAFFDARMKGAWRRAPREADGIRPGAPGPGIAAI